MDSHRLNYSAILMIRKHLHIGLSDTPKFGILEDDLSPFFYRPLKGIFFGIAEETGIGQKEGKNFLCLMLLITA